MFLNQIVSYGIAAEKKEKNAIPLTDTAWLGSLERCRSSFGLEGVVFDYWSYPASNPEVSIWIKNNKKALLLLSEGFLKVATESQVVVLFENLNPEEFQKTRYKNKQESYRYFISGLKGESRLFRYWIISFFLYPVERFFESD